MAVMHDTGDFLPRDQAAHRLATEEETLSIINDVRAGLDDGAPGIGFGIAYVPAAPRQERGISFAMPVITSSSRDTRRSALLGQPT